MKHIIIYFAPSPGGKSRRDSLALQYVRKTYCRGLKLNSYCQDVALAKEFFPQAVAKRFIPLGIQQILATKIQRHSESHTFTVTERPHVRQ